MAKSLIKETMRSISEEKRTNQRLNFNLKEFTDDFDSTSKLSNKVKVNSFFLIKFSF